MINDDVNSKVLSLQLHWYDQALENAHINIHRLLGRIQDLEAQIRHREDDIERQQQAISRKDAHVAQLTLDNQHLTHWIVELLRD